MNSYRFIPFLLLGSGAAAGLVFLCMVMTRTGAPKMSQRELVHLTKMFITVRHAAQPSGGTAGKVAGAGEWGRGQSLFGQFE